MGFFKALGDIIQFATTPFNDYELAIKSRYVARQGRTQTACLDWSTH